MHENVYPLLKVFIGKKETNAYTREFRKLKKGRKKRRSRITIKHVTIAPTKG